MAAIANITGSGKRNFAVETLDASGDLNQLLVNEIGAYKGTRLFDATLDQHSVAMKVTSSGSWSIVIAPVSSAGKWNGSSTLKGKGDDVTIVQPAISGLAAAKTTHTGKHNFAVTAYTADDYDLLINEIGKYSGEVQLPDGTVLLEMEADGAWSVKPS